MKFSFNRSALMGLFALAMCNGQAFAEDNLAFEGFKLSLGAGMVSAGGTATTTGTGVFSGNDTTAAGTGAFSGDYIVSNSSSFNPNNFVGRLELGYDWAVNENGILGLSLSKDFRSSDTLATLGSTLTLDPDGICITGVGLCSSSPSFRTSPSIVMDGPYALALRAGYATTKNSMVYAKISYAQSKLTGEFNKTVRGAGLGLGFEANLSESWFMRGELEAIQYAAFDVTSSVAGFTGTVTDSIKLRSNAARIMIGVRF
ncbi:MAG: outer membrane beta-barrel protein [Burkholderiaceae bacterium]